VRILFSSDLHGDREAYAAIARRLADHDCGIITGDLFDEFIPMGDAREFGLVPDDGLEELPGEDFDEVAEFEARARDAVENPRSVNRRGLDVKRDRLAAQLGSAGKPVYFVRGNHDIGEWTGGGLLVNIENREVHRDGCTIIGLAQKFRGVRGRITGPSSLLRRINGSTIVVCHAPPFGVMDLTSVRGRWDRRVRQRCIGDRRLRRLLVRCPPRFCLFGHVHEGFGVEGKFVNGAWPKERKLVSIDLDADTVSLV
jgi:Icc-related predicted phosphoesterase